MVGYFHQARRKLKQHRRVSAHEQDEAANAALPMATPQQQVGELQRLIGNRVVHRMAAAGALQRVIAGYKKGKNIHGNARIMRGLTKTQRIEINRLHARKTLYTTNAARKKVGAGPVMPMVRKPGSLPFAFRYDKNGQLTMRPIARGAGGSVTYPVGGLKNQYMKNKYGRSMRRVYALGIGKDDLPKEEKRKVTQTTVMDGISPNAAARALKYACPTEKSWEWLHMVAFSIGQTHVGDLSKSSKSLIKRTGQRQQISENLVLGTAAANTEMLSYETRIKEQLQQNSHLRLYLTVMADKTDETVENVTIPVARRISYHFYFQTGDNTYTAPVIVEFDTRSHHKPSTKSFEQVVNELKEALKHTTTLKEPLEGPKTDGMYKF